MGYIKSKQKVTEEKVVKTGMACDNCGKETNIIDDPSWHWFTQRTFYFNSDENDSESKVVCGPQCYFSQMKKLVEEYDDSSFRFDGMDYEFAVKMVEFYKSKK